MIFLDILRMLLKLPPAASKDIDFLKKRHKKKQKKHEHIIAISGDLRQDLQCVLHLKSMDTSIVKYMYMHHT